MVKRPLKRQTASAKPKLFPPAFRGYLTSSNDHTLRMIKLINTHSTTVQHGYFDFSISLKHSHSTSQASTDSISKQNTSSIGQTDITMYRRHKHTTEEGRSPGQNGHSSKHQHQESIKRALDQVTRMSAILQAALNIDNHTAFLHTTPRLEPWTVPRAIKESINHVNDAVKNIVWPTDDQPIGNESGWAVAGEGGDEGYAQEMEDTSDNHTGSSPHSPQVASSQSSPNTGMKFVNLRDKPLRQFGESAKNSPRQAREHPFFGQDSIDRAMSPSQNNILHPKNIDTQNANISSPLHQNGASVPDVNNNSIAHTPPGYETASFPRPFTTFSTPTAPTSSPARNGDSAAHALQRYKTPTNKPINPFPDTDNAVAKGTHSPNPRFWDADSFTPGSMLDKNYKFPVPLITISDALVNAGQQPKQEAGVGAKTMKLYDKLVKKPLKAMSSINFHVAGTTQYEAYESENENPIDKSTISHPDGTGVKIPEGYDPNAIVDLDYPALNAGEVVIPHYDSMPMLPPAPILTPTFSQPTNRQPLFLVPFDPIAGAKLLSKEDTRPRNWIEQLPEHFNFWLMHPQSQIQDLKLHSVTIGINTLTWNAPVPAVVANIDHNAKRVRFIHAKLPPISRGLLDPPDQPLEWVVIEIVWSFEKKSSSLLCLPRCSMTRANKISTVVSTIRVGNLEKAPAVGGYNVDAHKFDSFTEGFAAGAATITVASGAEHIF